MFQGLSTGHTHLHTHINTHTLRTARVKINLRVQICCHWISQNFQCDTQDSAHSQHRIRINMKYDSVKCVKLKHPQLDNLCASENHQSRTLQQIQNYWRCSSAGVGCWSNTALQFQLQIPLSRTRIWPHTF